MAEEPEIDPRDEIKDEEHAGEGEEFYDDLAITYEANTERLRSYTAFLRATVPRTGTASSFDGGKELELQTDVESARNLAVMAVYADIRRIAGDGRPNFDAEVCS